MQEYVVWGWIFMGTGTVGVAVALRKLLHRQRPLSLEWRAYNEPLPKLGKGLKAWKCETCFGQGVYNITMPTRELSFTDQMSMANQDQCPCCVGQCVHWRQPDSPPKCMKLKARGEHG
jgi:hypothetical protein